MGPPNHNSLGNEGEETSEPISFPIFSPNQPGAKLSLHPQVTTPTKIWQKGKPFPSALHIFQPEFVFPFSSVSNPPFSSLKTSPSSFSSASPLPRRRRAGPFPWQSSRLYPPRSPRSRSCASSCSPRLCHRSPATRPGTPSPAPSAPAVRYTSS